MKRVNLCVPQQCRFRLLCLIASTFKSFTRIPTRAEWIRCKKYARGMRSLKVNASKDLVTPNVFSTLQLHTGNNPLLPGLNSFECCDTTEAFTLLIPILLPPKVTFINIGFATNVPAVTIASVIVRLPILCPEVRTLHLWSFPRSAVITEAVSEMVLSCNRNTLRAFWVFSSLTEEARKVIHQLPNLRYLGTVIGGEAPLPPMALPNLTGIQVEYGQEHHWLQALHGTIPRKLDTVVINALLSAQTAGFLERFKNVTLATSTQNTLSKFVFRTSQAWNPDYSSLYTFKQLKHLEIEFSCHNGCSSRVDDDIVAGLARAMPKLEILRLGKEPCRVQTGITLKGLVTLACRCPRLSKLCIHLRAQELAGAAAGPGPSSQSEHAAIIPRTNCALKNLQVGETPIQEREVLPVALALIQIFPQTVNIEYTNAQWKNVLETIRLFKLAGDRVHHTSEIP